MQFRLFIFLCGSVILSISANSTSPITEESPKTVEPIVENEQLDTEKAEDDADESTQKIPSTTPEKIDESYYYQEPIDEYNNYKPGILYNWKYVEKAYDVKDVKFLRYFCTKLHELAGWGTVNVTNNFIMAPAAILYKNPMFFPTDMKYLQYVIQPPQTFEGNETMDHFYITEGLKEDCIFYLIPTDRQKLNLFNLGHHVCGVHYSLKVYARDSPKSDSAPAADSAQDSAPIPILASASDSQQDYDLSESASSLDLALSPVTTNTSLDYDLSESESGPEPVLKPNVHGPLEDLYIKYYGNDPFVTFHWTPIRQLDSDEDEESMKTVCIEYHKMGKKGSLKPEQLLVQYNRQLLKFRTKSGYRSRHIDVLWYGVNDTEAEDIDDMRQFFITRGMGVDCIFYLTPTDKTAMEFYLDEHVCKNSAAVNTWNRGRKKMDNKRGNKGKKTGSESVEEADETSSEEDAVSKSETPGKKVSRSSVEKANNKSKKNNDGGTLERSGRTRKPQHNGTTVDAATSKVKKATKSKTSKSEPVKSEKKKNSGGSESDKTKKAEEKKASRSKPNKSETNVKKNAGKSRKNITETRRKREVERLVAN